MGVFKSLFFFFFQYLQLVCSYFLFSFRRLCLSKNLSISSRLSIIGIWFSYNSLLMKLCTYVVSVLTSLLFLIYDFVFFPFFRDESAKGLSILLIFSKNQLKNPSYYCVTVFSPYLAVSICLIYLGASMLSVYI